MYSNELATQGSFSEWAVYLLTA